MPPVPPHPSSQPREVILSVTFTLLLFAPGALNWTVPEYVPADMLAGFTDTMIVPGVVPVVGLAVSQGPPEVEAEYVSGPPVVVSITFCDGGIEPPP